MARPRRVVQVERLRDQVYRLIRDDLKAGELEPGQRIVEGELAERYNVSRTPVREALLQLSQDGLLTEAPDRGYAVVVDTSDANLYRHEVRDLIDPEMARHAAQDATSEQRKALAKAQERQRAAHDAGQEAAFVEANEVFRQRLRGMCGNTFLAQCCALVEDQAQWSRRAAFARADYRELELAHSERLLAAVQQGDGDGAAAAMKAYVEAVRLAPV
ncbi:MAG TPA: GntR family transcriptional regulator [Caulobacteraceae bacterium]|jgi:DNA-binding GntR family transcriptional regulator|nr:GntR family transcriptional regulator [Caulobacteraceae bacterium]